MVMDEKLYELKHGRASVAALNLKEACYLTLAGNDMSRVNAAANGCLFPQDLPVSS